MTTEPATGSVEPTGIPADSSAAGSAPNGSGADGGDDLFSGLETGIREWVGSAGMKFDDPAKLVSDLVIKTRNAESLIGKSVQVPGDDAKPEDWDKFHGRIGRPEKADGYAFKLPDGLPEEMPYDGDFAEAFKPVAHTLGLTAKQAAGVHDFYATEAAGKFKTGLDAHGEAVTAATARLEKEWGKSESDEFKAKSESALRAVKNLGGKDDELMASLKNAGLLGDLNGVPYVVDAPIAIALAKVGDALFREDGLEPGAGGGTADNPFRDGPEKGNATQQNILWKTDQKRAETLIRAAGFTLEQFGFSA